MNSQHWNREGAKWASCLRRVVRDEIHTFHERAPISGDVLVCRVENADLMDAFIEDCGGRLQALFPGDVLLTTVAHRESTRWTVGRVPTWDVYEMGRKLTVLSVQGIVGELMEIGERTSGVIEVSVLGVAADSYGETINISRYSVLERAPLRDTSRVRATVLITGSSSEAGKTTAGLTATRALLRHGRRVAVLKALVFDTVDFGLATTYPSGALSIQEQFPAWLDYLFKVPADALVVECGGDPVGANVPSLISAIRQLGPPLVHVSAASDAMAALGLCRWFEASGIPVDLICGRCTDTALMTERVGQITGVPAENLAGRACLAVLEALLNTRFFLTTLPGEF
jgi:hypothetical protein